MMFLEGTFGYNNAIKIKGFFDLSVGVILGALILLWLVGKFFMEVYHDDKLPKYIAIMRVEKGRVLRFAANPKNVVEAVEVFIGHTILKIFRQKGIQLNKLRKITIIILIITLLIFFLGIVDSMYPYLPHYPLP